MSHLSDARAHAAAENWMRYILGGQITNLNTFFQPEKVAVLSWDEYQLVYKQLNEALYHLEQARTALTNIQLARKAP